MKRFALLLSTAALLSSSAVAAPEPFRRAVQTYYASNDRVQAAVYRDACQHGDQLHETKTARAKLKRPLDIRMYDLVSLVLGDAYEASEGTDGALEQVRKDFCSAADMR